MTTQFFLTSEDYIDNPYPRECVLVESGTVSDTLQRFYLVQISPPLPGYLAGINSEIDKLLLGEIDERLALEDIGNVPFVVDIYVSKKTSAVTEYFSRDLERIGCGHLHLTLKAAKTASSIGG